MHTLTLLAALLCGFQDAPAVRGFLGAGVAPAEGGLKIDRIAPGSPAEKAGLKVGDLIVAVDGKALSTQADFIKLIQGRGQGATIELSLSRQKDEKMAEAWNKKITLGGHPQDLLATPDESPGMLKVRRSFDISYGDHERNKLNLILPVTDKPFPVVMWIHAGAWSFGGRENETALGTRLAERGIGFAAISHRLTSGAWMDPKAPKEGVRHPAHIEDCAKAFAWLHKNIKERGGDPARLFVSGHSSGGHLSALLALDPRYLKAHDLPITAIRGSIPVGGGYELTKYHERLKEGMPEIADAHLEYIFGKPEDWVAASPTTYVKDAKVPMLVITEADEGFQLYKSDFEAVVPKGSPITFWTAEDRVHQTITAMMSRKEADAPRDKMIEFIRSQTSP
jgi:dienelactone hydrolase